MTQPATPARAQAVLDFWFGAPGSAEYGTDRDVWFEKNDAFDNQIRDLFLSDYNNAADGAYDDWQGSRDGALALIILLDQFPRNLFRSNARAFATDSKALEAAQAMIERGDDLTLNKEQRFFVYLPFEHAEDLAMQERSLELTAAMPQGKAENGPYHWAKQHHSVIARFGRFPVLPCR